MNYVLYDGSRIESLNAKPIPVVKMAMIMLKVWWNLGCKILEWKTNMVLCKGKFPNTADTKITFEIYIFVLHDLAGMIIFQWSLKKRFFEIFLILRRSQASFVVECHLSASAQNRATDTLHQICAINFQWWRRWSFNRSIKDDDLIIGVLLLVSNFFLMRQLL